jgi:hypothetical protein
MTFRNCQEFFQTMSVTHDMPSFVARNLSGFIMSPMDVANETDIDAIGDQGNAIGRGYPLTHTRFQPGFIELVRPAYV